MISARLGAGAQLSAINLFSQNRLIHFSPRGTAGGREGAGLESAETQKAPEAREHKSFTEKLDETGNNEFEAEWNSNALETSKQLAEKINVQGINGESLLARMRENYEKNLKPRFAINGLNISFEQFWKKTLNTKTSDGKGPFNRVFLEKHNDGKWYFAFRDRNNNLLELGAEQGVAMNHGAPPVELETNIRQAQARGAQRIERIERTSASKNYEHYLDGIKSAESNDDFELNESILPLIDNQRLWLDAWQNPDSVDGMRELKFAIDQAFPHLKSPDQVRTAIRKAVAKGSDRYIDFEDLIESIAEDTNNPLRLPSWALRLDQLSPASKREATRFASLINPGDANAIERFVQKDLEKNHMVSLAKGFAAALKTIPGADCRLGHTTTENTTLTVTVNNYIYYVTINDDAEIGIFNYPSKTPYKDSDGYDNYENFDADNLLTAMDGRPSMNSEERDTTAMSNERSKIATWFLDAVQPRTTDSDDILDTYHQLFNEDGTPKESIANRPDIIKWYRDVFAGSQRVMTALHGMRYNEEEAKRVAYEQASAIAQQRLERRNRTDLEKFIDTVAMPEDAEMDSGNDFWALREGLAQLDDGDYEKVTRMTAGLIQTLPAGTRATVLSPLPNHQVSGRPKITVKIKTPGYQAVTAEIIHTAVGPNIVRYTSNKDEKESFKYLESTLVENNPKVREDYLNTLDEMGMRETTWHDVLEGTSILAGEGTHETMSEEFAQMQLRNILAERGAIEANGRLNEAKAMVVLSALATKGLSDLNSIAYTETHDDRELGEVRSSANDKLRQINTTLAEDLITVHAESGTQVLNLTQEDLNNPQKAPLLMDLIRRGVAHEIQQREEMKKRDIEARLAELREEFENDPNGRAAYLKAIRDEYEKQGKEPPEDLEQKFDQNVFPLMLAFGIDLNTGVMGPGVGVGVDIPLDQYGTIHVGGGVAAGIDAYGENAGEVVGVGVGGGAGYTTPKWGPISVTVGGAAGVNVLDGGVGAALGGALNINLDKTPGRFNHDLSLGLAYSTFGVVPAALFSYSPNHEYRQESMWEDAQKVFNLEKENPTFEEIAANKNVARLIIARHADRISINPNASTEEVLNEIGRDQVLKDYQDIRNDLYLQVLRNYDPSKADSGATFGIGWDFKNGRFIALYAPNFVDYGSKEAQLRSTKDYESMQTEAALEQSFDILEQIREKGEMTPEEERRLTETGAVMRTAEGKLVVLMPNIETTPLRPQEVKEIESIANLGEALNEMYRPLNLGVTYDASKQMFELNILNQNPDTNYEIAHSASLAGEGIVYEDGKLYINSGFDPNNTFTIRRSDFRYPFPYEGKHTHSLITISSDPKESPQSIYANAGRVLRARGTTGRLNWQAESGPNRSGVDVLAAQPRHKLTNEQFPSTTPAFVKPGLETRYFGEGGIHDALTLEERERTAVSPEKEVEIKDFALQLLGENGKKMPFAREYRQLSNNNLLIDNSNTALIDAVQREWLKNHDQKMSDMELQKALNHLANLSFSELKGETKEQRRRAFEARLETIKPMLERQFQSRIEENHRNHPSESDILHIQSDAKTLADFAIERARQVVIEDESQYQRINIAQVDRYMSLAGTMGMEGMRGAGYTGINEDPLFNLVLMPDELKLPLPENSPEEADLIKMAFSSLSPLPREAEDFKKAPLTMQVFSLMKDERSALMFGDHPEYRYLIARFMSGELEYTEAENNAYDAFRKIVETIRNAELAGKTSIESPFNENFVFDINLDVRDGLYEKCTNYTMWIREGLGAHVKVPGEARRNFAGFAGYGESTAGAEVAGLTQPSTVYRLAVAAAVKPPGGPPGGPPGAPAPEVEDESGVSVGTGPDEAQPSEGGTGGGPVNAPGDETPQPGF